MANLVFLIHPFLDSRPGTLGSLIFAVIVVVVIVVVVVVVIVVVTGSMLGVAHFAIN